MHLTIVETAEQAEPYVGPDAEAEGEHSPIYGPVPAAVLRTIADLSSILPEDARGTLLRDVEGCTVLVVSGVAGPWDVLAIADGSGAVGIGGVNVPHLYPSAAAMLAEVGRPMTSAEWHAEQARRAECAHEQVGVVGAGTRATRYCASCGTWLGD